VPAQPRSQPSKQPSRFPNALPTSMPNELDCDYINLFSTDLDDYKVDEFLELSKVSDGIVGYLCGLTFDASESLGSCAQIIDVCLTMVKGDNPSGTIDRCDKETIYQSLASIGLNCSTPSPNDNKDKILYCTAAPLGGITLVGIACLGSSIGVGNGLTAGQQIKNSSINLCESLWGTAPGLIIAAWAITTAGLINDGYHDVFQNADNYGPELGAAIIEALALGCIAYQKYKGTEKSGKYESAMSKNERVVPAHLIEIVEPPPSTQSRENALPLTTGSELRPGESI